jgi:hypothetical protein
MYLRVSNSVRGETCVLHEQITNVRVCLCVCVREGEGCHVVGSVLVPSPRLLAQVQDTIFTLGGMSI